MLELRKASWPEVLALFHAHGGEAQAVKNCGLWADRYGLARLDYPSAPVSLQAWRHDEIAAELDRMATVEPRIHTDALPRCYGLPAAVVRHGDTYGLIDGKHRSNRWKDMPGMYAFLVIG